MEHVVCLGEDDFGTDEEESMLTPGAQDTAVGTRGVDQRTHEDVYIRDDAQHSALARRLLRVCLCLHRGDGLLDLALNEARVKVFHGLGNLVKDSLILFG